MIKTINGVNFIRTESQKGTSELAIGFNDKIVKRGRLADKIAELQYFMGDGFLYIPDAGADRNKSIHEIEIAVIGDDTKKCREVAQLGASAVNMLPDTIQTVLNFKNPEKTIEFIPNRDVLARSNITVENIASTLRWMMFGPVVDKWIQGGDEIDIRVAGKGLKNTNLDRIENLYIPSPSGGIRLNTLGNLDLSEGFGKIYRRDGRRAAYFTAHVNSSSSDQAVKLIQKALNGLNIEKGYWFVFSRELALLENQYRVLIFAFIGCLAGILILLTVLTENFLQSIIIVSIIPVSCVLPLLIKFVTQNPLEMGDIVGMVIISGLSVNNAIYITESVKSRIPFRIREKIQSILVTSLTSIVAAVPLIIMSEGGFSRALAASILWGTAGSLVATLVLFPAIFYNYTRLVGKLQFPNKSTVYFHKNIPSKADLPKTD
jgi:HAE1 family hydrophobic/amphiphilic exporter-1